MIVIFHIRQITNTQRYFNIRLGHRYMNTPTQMNQTSSGCDGLHFSLYGSVKLYFEIQHTTENPFYSMSEYYAWIQEVKNLKPYVRHDYKYRHTHRLNDN